ncbi:replication initiation factor domain-containing protein [Lactobacillus intestinalis]|uniref:replication initiation factor domain-containing protein n=1 Tax=Lactobacillus intestinalis TaxID=151781 RepID=UPI0025AA1B33|nr:replication initiation factor domain-containing protein [Lactobacillus intestinalis]
MTVSQSHKKNTNAYCKYPASPLLFKLSAKNKTNVCEIKLDEITVTGFMNADQHQDTLKKNCWVPGAINIIDGKPDMYNLFRDTDSIATLSKNKYYSDSWRIDTSNHLTEQEKEYIISIIQLFDKPRITRLDIAVDFINFDDSGMNYTLYKPNTKIFYTRGKDGKFESITAGVRKSVQAYRFYNKMAELQQKHKIKVPDYIKNWERLELQLRQTRSSNTVQNWYERAIKMLNCLILPDVNRLAVPSFKERAMINELLRHPEGFKELSSATRAKYRRKIRELNKKSVPARITLALRTLETKKNNIQDEINSFL